DQTRSSAALLHRWLREERITIGFLPPVLSEALFQEDLTGLPLRLLFTGSDLVRRYPPAALAASYVNTYGPTEATVIVTAGEVAPSPDEPDQPPAIGHPIANTG